MLPLSFSSIATLLNKKLFSSAIVTHIAVDTKKVVPGSLFFALKGQKVDGHNFLQEAKEKGAIGFVVHESYKGDDFALPILHVPDVLFALQELARASIKHFDSKIIGITGSLGKTTTKEFTLTILKKKFDVVATEGNANTKISIPLTLLNLQKRSDYLVIEMGMSEPGDIKRLLEIAPPTFSILTTVALVHASYFDSLEHIADGKAEIFSDPVTKVGIYNASMPFASKIKKVGSCEKISFSMKQKEADYFIEKDDKLASVYFKGEKVFEMYWQVRGEHNLQNFLAAVACAHQMGMTFEEIKEAAKELKLPPKRLEEIEKRGILFINDAYNANENSMCAALKSLPSPKEGGRKIAVLGDMRELGKFTEQAHKIVGNHALEYVDQLICTGEGCLVMEDIWKKANKPFTYCESKEELIKKVKETIQPGDVVLLKGSRSHALDLITEEIDS